MFRGCLIHIYLQDIPHFDSLILSNTFLCNFLFVFWLAALAFIGPFMFPTIYLLVYSADRDDWFLYFQIKGPSFL